MLNWSRLGSVRSSRNNLSHVLKFLLEILDGLFETLLHGPLGLPSDFLPGNGNVGLSLARIVGGGRERNDVGLGARESFDVVGEGRYSVFVWIAKIDRERIVGVHEFVEAVDEIIDELKAPGLRSIAVESDVFVLEGLDDEVGDDSAIVGVHAASKGVEDASDANIDA